MSNFIQNFKENQLKKILESHKDSIEDISDLVGDKKPSLLFYFLANKIGYVLDNDPEKCFTKEGIERRKKYNKFFKILGRLSLRNPQVIVDRNTLIDSDEKLPLIPKLPDRPVIFLCNHYFKDDIASSIVSSPRHGYVLFGSLPMLFGTIDGLFLWLNGVIAVNRNSKKSRQSTVSKCCKALELGANIFYYAEGVHNKSPEKLSLDFFNGVYRVAKESGVLIVPIHHYIKDPLKRTLFKNKIYTVIDDPIDISKMDERETCEYLRDIHSTWHYLMMEKFGNSTRKEVLNGFDNADEAWEDHLQRYLKGIDRYDSKIERSADYRPKSAISYLNKNGESIPESNIEIPHDIIIKTPIFDDFSREKVIEYLQLDKGDMEYLSDEDLEKYFRIMSWEEKIRSENTDVRWDGVEKPISRPEDVFTPIANLDEPNVDETSHIGFARKLVKREKRRDFQRRF